MTVHPEEMAHIECTFDGDPRLIAGAATIVTHMAHRAGLVDVAISDFTAAAVAACETIVGASRGAPGSHNAIRLAAAEFPDHIEVTIGSVPDAASTGSSQQSSGRRCATGDFADQIRQRLKSSSVDGLNVEAVDGTPQVTLVKNCGAVKRPFAR